MTLLVELSGHTVKLDPPQHLLLLQITCLADGFSFTVVPADAEEVSDFQLLSRSFVKTVSSEQLAAFSETAMSAVTAFPLVGELDVMRLPGSYKVMPATRDRPIAFRAGEEYVAVIVGNGVYQTNVVAT